MKKLLLSFVFVIFILGAFAAPFKFLPYKAVQPDGSVIECYLSGDEFFNWIHDKDGYSIIKGKDGYYYYAIKEKGEIIASSYRVDSADPVEKGLEKWTIISEKEYYERRDLLKIPVKNEVVNAPHTGQFNNLVIYIRFSGESEISTTREEYDDKLNPETGNTLKSYFKEVSYDQLIINSTHYPGCASPSTTNASYEDSHTRDYFQPYDASTNPNGYDGDSERKEREHQLLVDAVTWVNNNYPVDASLDIDGDGDGYVDNVCFMIQGNSDGWAELLWAHRWSLYSKTVYINGKRVYDYTFQPENQVSVKTLCHEMFHALGAPDLYHYYNGTSLSPVAYWDLMESGGGHMGAYMKYKYADQNWISDIPEITSKGTYSLNPLTSSTNNCYKIASPNSTSEFFILEYRKREGSFESNLPGDGLLVYRINSNFEGNAEYDGSSIFDEVYIYRPSGTTSVNGSPNSAHFSSDVSRTEINDETNPSSFLSNGSNGGLDISNITAAGTTISFYVNFQNVENPSNFILDAISTDQVQLNWNLNTDNDEVLLAYSTVNSFGTPEDGTSYSQGDVLSGGGEIIYTGSNTSYLHQSLTSGETYYYKIWSVNSSVEYSSGTANHIYVPCTELLLPLSEDFSTGTLPSCWQNVDNIGAGQAWVFNNPNGYSFGSTTGSNGFALLDSDDYGSGNSQNAELISPLLDLSIYSTVNLSFEHYFEEWDSELAELAYSIDGRQTWNVINSWTSTIGSQTTPDVYNADISAQVAGESEVYIRWRYEGSYGYYWFIDDISITGVSSGESVAQTKSANNIQTNSATLNGIINANDNSITQIEFEYGTSTGNYSQTITANPNTASGSSNTSVSANITGLTQSTEYFYRVKCMNGTTEVDGDEKSFVTESRPIVNISCEENEVTNANPIDILFSFSEEIKSFIETDITITNATINSVSHVENNDYNVEIVPGSDGEITIELEENSVEDLVGNGNTASSIFSIDYDNTLPEVVISSTEPDTTSTTSIPVTFTFSEDVTDFTIDDINVTNGSKSNFSTTDAHTYTMDIITSNSGNISVQVIADAVIDVAGNTNLISDEWKIYYRPTTGISDLQKEGIKLYPNPTKGLLNISYNNPFAQGEIKIIDYTGRVIYTHQMQNTSINKVDLTNQPSGLYIIVLTIDEKQLSTQFIIQ